MKDFEQILDDCIEQILEDGSSLEQCLARYPEEAEQLEPLLRAAIGLERSRGAFPGPAFTAQTREKLIRHMRRSPRRPEPVRSLSGPVRLVFSLTVLVLALLLSGTAYAQGSLPGDSFYSWKITSERALRAISRDPVGIDLFLAERRVREYRSVSDDPQRSERALQGYNEVLVRLHAETDTATRSRIEPVLKDHEKSWKDSGITIPELENLLDEKSNGETGDSSPPNQPDGLPRAVPADVLPTALAQPSPQAGPQ